jgi:hypothetical protein
MEESSSRRPGEREDSVPEHRRPLVLEIAPTTLKKRAAQLGTVAGQAVVRLRDIRRTLEKSGRGSNDRLRQFSTKARAKVDDLRHAASHPEHWGKVAKEKAAELQRHARTGYEKARSRANDVARERPLQMALAAGVAGFVLGTVARTWRAKRAG